MILDEIVHDKIFMVNSDLQQFRFIVSFQIVVELFNSTDILVYKIQIFTMTIPNKAIFSIKPYVHCL